MVIDYEMLCCCASAHSFGVNSWKSPNLCSDNKSCFLCPFQSLSVLDDSNPSSPASEFSGLVVEPNLSGRSHTLTFSSSEVSADQTWCSHRRSFAWLSCGIKRVLWKVKYCLVPPPVHWCSSWVVVIFSLRHLHACVDGDPCLLSVVFDLHDEKTRCMLGEHTRKTWSKYVFSFLILRWNLAGFMRFTWLMCVCIRCWMRNLALEGRNIIGRTVRSLIGHPSRCVIGWWVWTWISTHLSSAHRLSMDSNSWTWTVTDSRWKLFLFWS